MLDAEVFVKSRGHSCQTLSGRDFYDGGRFLGTGVGEERSRVCSLDLSLQTECFLKTSSSAGLLPKSCQILFSRWDFLVCLTFRLCS